MIEIPVQIRAVMADLEARDARDRNDDTPQRTRLRAIKPDVGRFLVTLILSTGAKKVVEIGTSGGYSGLWLTLALRRTGGRLTTFEVDPAKVSIARETFSRAGVADLVELRHADGCDGLRGFHGEADMVFIDAEKADYLEMLPDAVEALRPGGLLVADNLTSHADELAEFREAALAEPRLNGVVAPIGGGELVAVKL